MARWQDCRNAHTAVQGMNKAASYHKAVVLLSHTTALLGNPQLHVTRGADATNMVINRCIWNYLDEVLQDVSICRHKSQGGGISSDKHEKTLHLLDFCSLVEKISWKLRSSGVVCYLYACLHGKCQEQLAEHQEQLAEQPVDIYPL